ncbi:hypothetical protein RhiJN_24620 [Ceratobasidium sp. AG-Ba]|nr:hypothetical protein RhiJN_24620 [Ceratobasidium sp. AG-Ba]
MHAILFAHRLLDLLPHTPDSPTFNPNHVRVIRRLVKVISTHVHHPLPTAATECNKARAKWTNDNFDALVLIATSLNLYVQPLTCPNAFPFLYRSVVEALWSDLQRNVELKLELRSTLSAGLTYLSGPIDQLEVDHRAYRRVMARCPRVNKYEVGPEVFMLSEMGEFERRGIWARVFCL